MIFAMSCISLLGSVVWGHHMYTVGLETDTRAYFSGVTILISLPTGTKIFNWLSTYLGNPPLLQLKTNSPFFGLLFLLMFTIGGSTGIILGNAAVDLGLHDTYYVVTHFHFVLSLGAVIAIFSGVIFNGEKIVGSKNLLPSSSSRNSLYHLVSTFIGILLTFSPMHFLGFNVMPRRIPDFPDSFHSWNFLSSIGSGITFLSFAIFFSLPGILHRLYPWLILQVYHSCNPALIINCGSKSLIPWRWIQRISPKMIKKREVNR
jgi:heme/copper-type cytochrome/quinol oxidase subunit 1